MNRNKRICGILLAALLMLGVALSLGIGGVFGKTAEVNVVAGSKEYIYFDLAAGKVNIGKTKYSGYVFIGGTATEVTGAHEDSNKYYIYQSNLADKAKTGYKTEDDFKNKNCMIPEYSRVKNGDKAWTDFVENNQNVKEVSLAWDAVAVDFGRTSTPNNITFASESGYTANVIIDNIWSTYHKGLDTRNSGGIGANLRNSGIRCNDTHIKLQMKGDNRVGCVHYSADKGDNNTIEFNNGETTGTPGSITVADFYPNWNGNYWSSAIGGADSPYNQADVSDGIIINSGVIFAGTTSADDCTAIGGGGNNFGGVTINGGTVTAVAASTGTAIGGGIGWGSEGGDADVRINDGTVYAYNHGIGPDSGSYVSFVPAVAIGGGSASKSRGNKSTVVTITGGRVYAQSVSGAAIGGGGSGTLGGGDATVNISGGTVIAKSVGGTVNYNLNGDKKHTETVSAGVSIGGGTGVTSGGSVTLNISGEKTIVRTGSIGGGLATGKDAEGNPYKVGNANVTVSGGDIIGQVIMAGGAENPCSFTMTGGTIHSTDVINGVTIGNTNITGVTVTDPQPDVPLSFIRQDGGAVFMNDPNGSAIVTGGLIGNCTANNGGAIYMAGGSFILSGSGELGTNHAKFSGGSVYVGGGTVQIGGGVTLEDGTVLVEEGSEKASACAIRNSDAGQDGGALYVGNGTVTVSGGNIRNSKAAKSGGGMYVGGGDIHVSGGLIRDNTASENGGGMYVGGGNVDVSGGTISNNTATLNGGGAYIAGNYSMTAGEVLLNKSTNGGGIYVNDGIVTMYGGKVDSNTATESGGGMYISSTTKAALVDIFSGSISGNNSKTGGGISVVSESNQRILVTLGIDCVHPDLNEGNYTPFAYPVADECGKAHLGHTNHIDGLTHSSCPQVKNNVASEDGGGFFLSSSQTYLVFYCIHEDGNIANGNTQCYNMNVLGGHVVIGDSSYDPALTAPAKGNIIMQSSIFVEGGTVDIYGEMDNPLFTEDVTVDIKQDSDHYIDHRITIEEELTHYKVHYYENFKGDGDTATGLYIARQYPDAEHADAPGDQKYDFTIMSSIFAHPGYKIVGWNTKPDGSGKEYNVNETYNLKELDTAGEVGATNSGGTVDNSLLVIYAIWERSGYVLKFDPNVGEGETYTGAMDVQMVTMGLLGSQSISKNRFERHGYKFIGWTLTPTPTETDTVYADGHVITEDFTVEDEAIITLYANWERCQHVDSLIYAAYGNLLTQSCSACDGHTATATISAVNAYFDNREHPATVTYPANWLGDRPEVTYEMMQSDWDAIDDIDDIWNADTNRRPLHAGNYTAMISIGGTIAHTEYVIIPVKWQTPEVPQISFKVDKVGTAYNSVITIVTPTGGNLMYKITNLHSDGTETDVDGYLDWQSSNEFGNIPYGKYYYFYAKASADRDHIESDSSKSSVYLTTGGNIVYIENGIGINVEQGSGTGEFVYFVSAADGYHFRGYNDNLTESTMEIDPANLPDFVKPIPGVAGNDAHIQAGGVTITREGPVNGVYTYKVKLESGLVAYHQITLKFSGAAKNAVVTSKVTDGQVFGDFNSKDTSISRDSAFTAQFTVSDYIPDEYTSQALKFSQTLPAGATVIMKVGGGYWYYAFGSAAESVNLTDFTEMGGDAKFNFDTADTSAKTFSYQFIVDFSKATGNSVAGNLDVILQLTANASHSAPSVLTEGNGHVSLNVQNEAAFDLGSAVVDKKSATLNCTYTPSAGAASIWDGRKTALVLTVPEAAPSDLRLTAVVGGNTTLYTMKSATDSSGNTVRRFIIPLGDIGTKEVKITLRSDLFGSTGENLAFTADWYVSQSGADKSPLNGYSAATCNVTFSCKKDAVPSLRIDGTKYLCNVGERLQVDVKYAGIPVDGTITAYLQSKNGGQFVDTGAKVNITPGADGSKRVEFNLGQMPMGSYRILVIIRESGVNILQVPYYFVIA